MPYHTTMKQTDKKDPAIPHSTVLLSQSDSDCDSTLIIDCHKHAEECARLRKQINDSDVAGIRPSWLSNLKTPQDYNEIIMTGFGRSPELFYDFLLMAKDIRRRGGFVRVVLDGLINIYCGRDVTPDLEGNVDAITIPMIAQNEAIYNRYYKPEVDGAFQNMLDFAHNAHEFIPDTTLLAIEGLPDVDIEACRRLAQSLSVNFKSQPLSSLLFSISH